MRRFPHPEVGTWPHVRGVVGLSMPDTDDAQFFIDLVDNPRFDHQYTVFAQVLNGADVVDQHPRRRRDRVDRRSCP